MKAVIKLAILAVIFNAMFRIGGEYVSYYQFRDTIREAAMFTARTDDELGQAVMESATTFSVPLDPDGFTMRRDGREALVVGSYTKPIELFPGYKYPWKFPFTIQAYVNTVPPLAGAPPKPRPPKK
jgi:hypothetical protein